MAIFRIKPADSVFTDFAGDNAFDDDTAGADTLIVDPGAFLIAAGAAGDGAFLAPTGAWTVTVNGSIVSQNSLGISLALGNTVVSTIKIGVDGEVSGGSAGVLLASSGNVNNAGEISGTLFGIELTATGTHTITNSGTIVGSGGGIVDVTGFSNDTVRNSGQIIGVISLTGGNDKVTDFAIVGGVMKSGTITGTVSLGDGNDTFVGGANSETVQDGNGADTVSLGGGNDAYIATGNGGGDGVDVIKGGAGIDTYDASLSSVDLDINLDSIAHDLIPTSPGVAANTATGADISGPDKDTIFGFENAKGGAGLDIIYGSVAGNTLLGGAGEDTLFGLGGNDTLIGEAGFDDLVGGAGKDQLTGGSGVDFFRYTALSDSGITAATRDLITDFEQGSDHIDLSLIDANKTTAGTNDAFTFIGTNVPFTGSAGQLHAYWTATGQIIEGDVNGDKKADFSIQIADPTHAITLASTDFVL